MPLWTLSGTIGALMRGVPFEVFNETLSDGNESIALAIPQRSGEGQDITYTIVFASTPTTVDYLLQVAVNNIDAEFYDVVGSNITDTAGGKVTVNGIIGRFVRVKAVDSDTISVTSEIMVG